MMRPYHHTVVEDELRRRLSGSWSDRLRDTRTRLADGSTAHFNLTDALDVYHEGVCFAWGFGDDNALTQLRQEITSLVTHTLDRYRRAEIQQISSYQTLARAGAGDDVETLQRLATALDQRARRAPNDRDPHGYRHDLLDGLIDLVVGHDAKAQAASVRLHRQFHHVRTPPGIHLDGIPHAIDAVARRDQAALDDAADYTTELFVDRVAPLRNRAAGPESLLYPTLTLICRTATWRGMRWPTSPYIMSVDDDPSTPRLTGLAR